MIAQVTGITKIYGKGHTQLTAVDNVSLDLNEGEIALIMGPSGSGKTTFLSMLGGLLSPTSGSIVINGQDSAKLKKDELSEFRLNNIGFIFQSFNLLSALTALENTALPLMARGLKKKTALEQAFKLLEKLGLKERANYLPKDLSGGEKQRVAIARALSTNPKIILADEPTANLDSKNGHEVMQKLCSLACAERKAVIIVSHDNRIKDIAHRVLWLEDGKIIKREAGSHNETCPHHSA